MATKQQAAATPDKPLSLAEQALQHSVYFNASTCEIKNDVVQLAAVWVRFCPSTAHTEVQHCHLRQYLYCAVLYCLHDAASACPPLLCA
jgi:hypothetical protein